jgi:hypothetical protein
VNTPMPTTTAATGGVIKVKPWHVAEKDLS